MADLRCRSGNVEVNPGDQFRDEHAEWEVVDFIQSDPESDHTVRCRCLGQLPGHWERWKHGDGTVDWCGDSIAAIMLTKADGKPRSARGDLLRATHQ